MIRIDKALTEKLSSEAKASPRLRKNYNFHKHPGDPLQRLLNAMEPGTYVRPHKHENPDKREIFFVLKGKAAVVEFDEHGTITDHVILDPLNGSWGTEVAERTFHTVIPLEPGTMTYECKDGPYDPLDDKNFATWAPLEGTEEASVYLQKITEAII
jgi:cupin fold WbuC family metalloprotein